MNKINFSSDKLIRYLFHVLALMPLIILLWDLQFDNLTANPIQNIMLRTGKPALVLLVAVLSITPLRKIFGLNVLIKYRRAIGLYAFLYASIHFMVFVGLDYGFDIDLLRNSVFKKPYVILGLLAYLTLVPLAITSSSKWIRILGKYWKWLHKIIYLTVILAVGHYIWAVKSDIRQPLLFALIVLLMLVLRVPLVTRVLHVVEHRLRSK